MDSPPSYDEDLSSHNDNSSVIRLLTNMDDNMDDSCAYVHPTGIVRPLAVHKVPSHNVLSQPQEQNKEKIN